MSAQACGCRLGTDKSSRCGKRLWVHVAQQDRAPLWARSLPVLPYLSAGARFRAVMFYFPRRRLSLGCTSQDRRRFPFALTSQLGGYERHQDPIRWLLGRPTLDRTWHSEDLQDRPSLPTAHHRVVAYLKFLPSDPGGCRRTPQSSMTSLGLPDDLDRILALWDDGVRNEEAIMLLDFLFELEAFSSGFVDTKWWLSRRRDLTN